jgi:hypothetical protein
MVWNEMWKHDIDKKKVGKNGTNIKGLKKKPTFKGTYFSTSSLV